MEAVSFAESGTDMFLQLAFGASTSSTFTVKEQTTAFPDGSETLKVLTVLPIGKTDPLGNARLAVLQAQVGSHGRLLSV